MRQTPSPGQHVERLETRQSRRHLGAAELEIRARLPVEVAALPRRAEVHGLPELPVEVVAWQVGRRRAAGDGRARRIDSGHRRGHRRADPLANRVPATCANPGANQARAICSPPPVGGDRPPAALATHCATSRGDDGIVTRS